MNRLLFLILPLAACQQGADNDSAAADPAAAAKAARAAQPFAAGQWESTTTISTVEMAGVPAGAMDRMAGTETKVSYCMTPEQAAQSPQDMLSKSARGTCDYERFDMAGGRIDARMRCAGGEAGGTSVVEMNGTYASDRYEMAMEMTVTAPGMPGDMVMKASTVGRRTGACAEGSEGAAR